MSNLDITSNADGLSPVRRWFLSLRPYSFTASLMPILLAVAISVRAGDDVLWWTFPLYAVAGILFHAGTNVLNDYFDYTNGVDRKDDIDPTHVLTQGIVTPRFMLVSGHVYFALGIVVGSLIGFARGPVFVSIGIAGAIAAYFYTGARISLKYVALGDILVFFLLGPVMVAMGLWSLTGEVTSAMLAPSVPMAFLVTAILHGNNLRDLSGDRQAGVRTIANLVGAKVSRHLFMVLILAPFAFIGAYISSGLLHPIALVTFVSIVPAVRLLKAVYGTFEPVELARLPADCAALHLLFSLLLILSIVVTPFFATV